MSDVFAEPIKTGLTALGRQWVPDVEPPVAKTKE